MHGSQQEFSEKFERHRSYLRLIARCCIPSYLGAKIDVSDVVQETLIKAHAARGQFRGNETQEIVAWLKMILRNRIKDKLREQNAEKRDATLERSIDDAIAESSTSLAALLPAQQSTPSQQALQHEQLLTLADAIAELAEDQRTAVELHHFDYLSLEETAGRMNRSANSVAGLLRRGLAALRKQLVEDGTA